MKERAGLKTVKTHDRGAPYLLIQHNSGCRRHKVKVLYGLVRGFFVKGNLHYQTKPGNNGCFVFILHREIFLELVTIWKIFWT
jgi:hypothetical protein